MPFFSGLIALALMGADGSPKTGNEHVDRMMRARVHVFEMDGLGWRDAVHHKLTLVGQRGNTTIWTAPVDVLATLNEKADKIIATPRVVANPGSPATVSTRTVRHYVSSLGRIADGPVGQATRVAFQPDVEPLIEGFSAKITGRALDQGVLTTVSIEDVWCVAFHTATFKDTVKPDHKSTDKPAGPTSIQANYQVPEVATTRVSGEWLIPKNEILVVSLGAQTVSGKPTILGTLARVRERIAVIEATANPPVPPTVQPHVQTPRMALFVTPIPPITSASPISPVACAPLPVPSAIPISPIAGGVVGIGLGAVDPMVRVVEMPLVTGERDAAREPSSEKADARASINAQTIVTSPANSAAKPHPRPKLPSRHLPQAFDAQGDPVVLPPLPDETAEALAAESRLNSDGDPRPSPQSKARKSKTDQSSTLASGETVETSRSDGAIELKGRVTIRTQDGLVIEADSIVLRPSRVESVVRVGQALMPTLDPSVPALPTQGPAANARREGSDSAVCSDAPHPAEACEAETASCRYASESATEINAEPELALEKSPADSKSPTVRIARIIAGYRRLPHSEPTEAPSDPAVDPTSHEGGRKIDGSTYQYRVPVGRGRLEFKVQVGRSGLTDRTSD